jgi:hypothetical protein
MRYKTLTLERIDGLDVVVKRLQIAFAHRDAKQIEENMERLDNAVNALRNMINMESDDMESQFTMGK